MANTGRVYTLIVKGDPKEAEKILLTDILLKQVIKGAKNFVAIVHFTRPFIIIMIQTCYVIPTV